MMDLSDNFEESVRENVDTYFKKSKDIINNFGDKTVTYAVFMRHEVISAPRFALEFLEQAQKERDFKAEIDLRYPEGTEVPEKTPILYITGPMSQLIDLETEFLGRLGAPSLAAYNAFAMCRAMPETPFLDMAARHCSGAEMAKMMSYGAAIGGKAAQKIHKAKGFIGGSTDAGASFFGNEKGMGTMPHALIGYAGSTLRAAEMYHEQFPDENLTILPDFFGKEITDTIEVAKRFPDLAKEGKLLVRLDTAGNRYLEGLDEEKSNAVIQKYAMPAYRAHNEKGREYLVGKGVSAAAIFYLREQLDEAGFPHVKIVASSGFSPDKCKVLAVAKPPIDIVGTGSYIPAQWSESYATADIIAYDGKACVKKGRENLLKNAPKFKR